MATVSHATGTTVPSPVWDYLTTYDFRDQTEFNDVIAVFLVSLIGFAALFAALDLYFSRPRKDPEFGQRIGNLLHSVLSCAILTIAIFKHDATVAWDGPSSYWQKIALVFSLGYFLVDTFVQCVIVEFSIVFVFHHMASAVCLFHAVFHGACGMSFCVCLFVGEFTNPMMNGRWLLFKTGQEKTRLFKATTIAWYISYTLIRILGAPGVAWAFSFAPFPLGHIITPVIFAGSVHFFYVAVTSDLKGEVWL